MLALWKASEQAHTMLAASAYATEASRLNPTAPLAVRPRLE